MQARDRSRRGGPRCTQISATIPATRYREAFSMAMGNGLHERRHPTAALTPRPASFRAARESAPPRPAAPTLDELDQRVDVPVLVGGQARSKPKSEAGARSTGPCRQRTTSAVRASFSVATRMSNCENRFGNWPMIPVESMSAIWSAWRWISSYALTSAVQFCVKRATTSSVVRRRWSCNIALIGQASRSAGSPG